MPDPDFRDVNERLARHRLEYLLRYAPAGKRRGRFYYLGDPDGAAGESFPVPLQPRHERFSDFASGWTGDDLALLTRLIGKGEDMSEGRREAVRFLGIGPASAGSRNGGGVPGRQARPSRPGTPGSGPDRRPGAAPSGEAAAPMAHLTGRWTYLDAAGEPWLDVCRIDRPGRRKLYRQFDHRAGKWVGDREGGRLPEPRPLYNLPAVLAADPALPVLFVAGEKCCDALAELGLLATTNLSGEASIGHADLAPLAGRRVRVWPDADRAGKAWAATLAERLRETGAAVAVATPPPGKPEGWDAADAVAEGWTADAVDALFRALRVLSVAALAGLPVPERRWIVGDLIPAGHVTFITGKGAVGKTTLLAQLAMALSLGEPWLGLPVPEGRPLAVLCEDDRDELHRRFATLANAEGRHLRDYPECHYLPRLGEGSSLLMVPSSRGVIEPTPFFHELREQIGDTRRRVLFLDGTADVYGGDVNDTPMVTCFLNCLPTLFPDGGGTVVLVGHPNKAGAEFAGCMAWENKPRARLFLARPPTAEGEEEDPADPRRALSASKANLAERGRLDLVFRGGVFRRDTPEPATLGDRIDAAAALAPARTAFLGGLDRLAAMNISTSENPRAANYAPRKMLEIGVVDGFRRHDLEDAMRSLLRDGVLKARTFVCWSGTRNKIIGLGRAGEGVP